VVIGAVAVERTFTWLTAHRTSTTSHPLSTATGATAPQVCRTLPLTDCWPAGAARQLRDLEVCATTAAELGQWDFHLAVAPARFAGTSGSPVKPIATF